MRNYNNLHALPNKKFTDIKNLFETNAQKFGDKVQYYYKEDGEVKEFTYNDYWNTMKSLGTYLMNSDLNGKRIAICGETHPYWTASFSTLISCGCVAVPLDKELDFDQLCNFMKIAECSAVIFTGIFNKKFAEAAESLPFIDKFIAINDSEDLPHDDPRFVLYTDVLKEGEDLLLGGFTTFENHEIDMDKMSALLFTSGTTGTSKGVMLSHRNISSCAAASCAATRYGARDHYVSVLPIHHTFELVPAHLAACNGGSSIFINDSIKYAMKNFKEQKPTVLVLVPMFLETVHKKIWDNIRKKGMEEKVRRAMAMSDKLLLAGVDMRSKFFGEITDVFGGRLKSVVVGGAPLDPQIVKDFYSFGITVIQGYGITECAPLISVNRPGHIKFDSVGQVVDCCEIKILPLEGCPEGEGEIIVKGDNVMLGYYNNPEATAEAFTEDGWFRTGDIGTIDANGYVKITGRKKNVIIASNGKNVFPEELEERLYKIPLIKEVAVIGRKNEEDGSIIITALIYPDKDEAGRGMTHEEICEELKNAISEINHKLPAYKHIDKFETRNEEFEKTPSKKIKRFLLK